MNILDKLIFVFPSILIALTVHEFSHAYAAYLQGDKTSKEMGRLTLNPIKHIDPMGMIMLFIFQFGWAKPVVFDQRNLKHKKLGRIFIAMAGPFSNLILGTITAIIIKYLYEIPSFVQAAQSSAKTFEHFASNFLIVFTFINYGLFVFNMLPIAPLDGSHVVLELVKMPYKTRAIYKSYGFPILLFMIFSDRLIGIDLLPISKLVNHMFNFIMRI